MVLSSLGLYGRAGLEGMHAERHALASLLWVMLLLLVLYGSAAGRKDMQRDMRLQRFGLVLSLLGLCGRAGRRDMQGHARACLPLFALIFVRVVWQWRWAYSMAFILLSYGLHLIASVVVRVVVWPHRRRQAESHPLASILAGGSVVAARFVW